MTPTWQLARDLTSFVRQNGTITYVSRKTWYGGTVEEPGPRVYKNGNLSIKTGEHYYGVSVYVGDVEVYDYSSGQLWTYRPGEWEKAVEALLPKAPPVRLEEVECASR